MSTKNFSLKAARLALVSVAVSALAACSADLERLGDYPPVKPTSSISKNDAKGTRAPVQRVARGNLNAPGAPGSASQWRKPARSASATGALVVKPGQTLYSIARANGKSVRELAAANGITPPYAVHVGQRLIIPGVANPISPAPTLATGPAAAPTATPTRANPRPNFSGPRTHTVAAGETLFSLGRKYGVNPFTIAAHNGLPRNARLNTGQVLRIPAANGWSMAAAPRRATERPATSADHRGTELSKTTRTADMPRAGGGKDNSRIGQGDDRPLAKDMPKLADNDLTAGFRWPVRGRVISAFGAKPDGTRNEGVNIAVPEGADVHAAADGVVAYAGNELKGYGNLVLIRHKDGWVTAYAHNRELFVKRGDRIRRGQVIAKAGKTGAVKTPQLHFEIRKGATAVNPLKHLGRATAAR